MLPPAEIAPAIATPSTPIAIPDTTTAPELDSFVKELEDVNALNINCEKLVYLSSAGLRVLLVAHKKMNGKMKLTNVCELVMEVLELTGFADILTIE